MHHKWKALRLRIAPSAYDVVSAIIWELGGTGVRLESETKKAIRLLAYFDKTNLKKTTEDLFSLAKRYRIPKGQILSLQETYTLDEDWLGNWRRSYKSFPVGERFLISPTWEKVSGSEGRIIIRLDPGMAFGSGTHESTQLCLLAIERYLKAGMSVLDVGTGSGILAIAAAKLLAQEAKSDHRDLVTAIDEDRQAVAVAKKNVRANKVSGVVRLLPVALEAALHTYHFVLANLTANVIAAHADLLVQSLKAGGFLILSGILKSQKGQVLKAFKSHPVTKVEAMGRNEWLSLVFKLD